MKRSTCEWPLLYQRMHYPSDESMAVLKLRTHLFIRLDERSGANICSSPGCARVSRQYKDGHKTHYASGRTFLLLERRTTKGTSSGRIMRFVPVFIQEACKSRRTTKLFAQVRPDGQCVLSLIKAANESSNMCYPSVSDG